MPIMTQFKKAERLEEVAERLRSSVRQSDLVARLGGDEFTVVMDGLTDPGVIAGFRAVLGWAADDGRGYGSSHALAAPARTRKRGHRRL